MCVAHSEWNKKNKKIFICFIVTWNTIFSLLCMWYDIHEMNAKVLIIIHTKMVDEKLM